MQTPPQPQKHSLLDVLFLPFGCLVQASPLLVVGVLLLGVIIGEYAYYNFNSDLLGLARPNFGDLLISSDFTHIHSQRTGTGWVVVYEKSGETTFRGLVRHATPIRLERFPNLTHDILVTTGDFADPNRVSTSVFDHHFTWFTTEKNPLNGTIHLLHTIPLDEATYNQLLSLRSGQQVSIRGREVLRIEAYQPDGSYSGKWEDSGCNSLVVTSVEVLPTDGK